MGSRYIELFRTTQAEVQQLFNARQQIINAQENNGIINNQKIVTTISQTNSVSNGIINVCLFLKIIRNYI
jgi:hypothetical protein